ncbi:bestrophin family protein [Hanstruepera ponticola]|uniref:bestrophin family protein n=1 Tax=Hanstruepera ponticola TaxID=2042995 RepID=UPI000CF09A33|nr:bestrophin family ion channel [Hanstruepera ponticola]
MYTRRIFPVLGVIKWTRRYIFLFLLIGIIPVFLFEVVGLKWLHVPWLPLGVLGTAVAFITGFKNNAAYDRLWEARKIWGGIVNSSRSWTVMVKDFITNNHSNLSKSSEELRLIKRELVHRHVAWLTALRYQLRKDKPWELHLKGKHSAMEVKNTNYIVYEDKIPIKEAINGYISEGEYNTISSKSNQASQLLGVQSERLKQLKEEGLIDNFRHMEMSKMLTELYTLQGKSERIKNFPYPRQFATLNYIFIWIFILLIPYGIMEEFEAFGDKILIIIDQSGIQNSFRYMLQKTIAEHFVWFSIPFSALISWVFHTMEVIGEISENPFEGGPNDVPITDLSRSIEIDIRQLIDDTEIPEPYEWKNDVVM